VRIRYEVAGSRAIVRLDVYDVGGRHVRELVNGPVGVGEHIVIWDARDAAGRATPAGVYLVRMRTGGFLETQKVLLTR
jgi:hypothetical protein